MTLKYCHYEQCYWHDDKPPKNRRSWSHRAHTSIRILREAPQDTTAGAKGAGREAPLAPLGSQVGRILHGCPSPGLGASPAQPQPFSLLALVELPPSKRSPFFSPQLASFPAVALTRPEGLLLSGIKYQSKTLCYLYQVYFWLSVPHEVGLGF